ncbi:MAG: DNA translocase FtsK 4TM domain-containing protein [Pseudomonadota bacterium]
MSVLRLRALEAVLDDPSVLFARRAVSTLLGILLIGLGAALAAALATWTVTDPSLTHATSAPVQNVMGVPGAAFADPVMQLFGLAAPLLIAPLPIWGYRLIAGRPLGLSFARVGAGVAALFLAPGFFNAFPVTEAWPLPMGLGGVIGGAVDGLVAGLFGIRSGTVSGFVGGLFGVGAVFCLLIAVRPPRRRPSDLDGGLRIRRQFDDGADEYGLDETDTYEESGGKLAAWRGAIAHHTLALRARLRAEPKERKAPGGLRAALARSGDEDRDAQDIYRSRRRTAAAAPAFEDELPLMPAEPVPTRAAAPRPQQAAARPQPRRASAPQRSEPEEPVARGTHTFPKTSRGPAAHILSRQHHADPADFEDDAHEGSAEGDAPFAPDQDPAAHWDEHDAADTGEGAYDDRRYDEAAHDDTPYADEPLEDGNAHHTHGLAPEEDWHEDADPRFAHQDVTATHLDEGDLDEGDVGERERGEGDYGEDYVDYADEDEFIEDEPYPTERSVPHTGASPAPAGLMQTPLVTPAAGAMKPGRRVIREAQTSFLSVAEYEFPPLALLTAPAADSGDHELTEDALEANARVLEGVLDDFGVKGSIIHVRPGPVVTLYELEPAPGIKSSRVIGLADDIARSMSAVSARVAVIPGKNAIGIELPNRRRITVFLREILASADFERTKAKLPMCLGKTIGGEAVIADLTRMPHLLVAGTTGSGKSVSVNTMILSLLYRLKPEECRVILIDPKMLELSVYDGIPHLLTPVVTDPKKAVVALKWAVREMEDRYRKMAKLGVRNIDGYNARLKEAGKTGERVTRIVQTGFDKRTGEAIFEEEVLDLAPMPFIVVIVDEMADLMMVAGKDIEGAIQRLAQMARAAGIHLIMATQRPSVDVITGTIKANFPTRISFQVTSKIDSRTILGEMGAEQLLGMGDMLFMAGGGRIQRVHGPFVSDEEVEEVVAHLKLQGVPDYLTAVLEDEDEEPAGGEAQGGLEALSESDDLYDRAVALVLRDRKASTSYVQRRLSIGYNRAATLIERMEKEGVVSPANHAGKREILVPAEEEV